ncbi:MAG: ATP synthase F1 subunit epsilon [Verrucomicrobia bacterium]|nr:ATP synthase F1 subunit epsilon [Verrucomicrobiota bacterium]MBS0636105.1 ATP synthase F1 subunit epsilon [Verrucomicrobiota bacterium]
MLNVHILTSEEVYYKAEAVGVVAPGSDGYLEILTNHASLITVLKEGELVVFNSKKEEHSYKITAGFLEVHQNNVSVLVDEIEVLKTPHMVLSGLT